MSNKELAKESHKPVTKKCKKIKVHLSFIDDIYGANIDKMWLISKLNKEIHF